MTERSVSGALGIALSLLSISRVHPLLRAVSGVTSAALLARSLAGHCAVKAAITGHTSLREGVSDQLRCLSRGGRAAPYGLPGSPAFDEKSDAVDDALDKTFPASDPLASRLPDEPPVNAEAMWAAERSRTGGAR
jgi:hypothetical protein